MTEKNTKYLGQHYLEMYENMVPYKLDLTDRKILYLLTINARFSHTLIAKILKTHREVVAYRIKRMQEEGVLLGVIVHIDERKLGFLAHFMLIKLKAVAKEKELIQELLKIKEVTSLKNTSGAFDLLFRITTASLEEFEKVLEKLFGKYGALIEDHLILARLRGGYIGHAFVLEKELRDEIDRKVRRERKDSSFYREFQMRKELLSLVIDEKDRKLLDAYQFDARISLHDLGKKVGLSPLAVENRIRKLIRSGVIVSFLPEIACNRLGYQYYDLLLSMKDVNERAFLAFLKGMPHVYWYTKQIGLYNYKLSIFAQDISQFHNVLNQIRSAFTEQLTSFTVVTIFNQYYYQSKVLEDETKET